MVKDEYIFEADLNTEVLVQMPMTTSVVLD